MLITGARVAFNATQAVEVTLQLRRGKLSLSPKPSPGELVLHLNGYLILPGLINAHDHLELNLFPRLGRGPYRNATEWARDIYRPRESPIREHSAVPKGLRFHWGALKNLASGVTTVAHHNPPRSGLFRSHFPIRVLQRYRWAHSLTFSPDWRVQHRSTPPTIPFLIHAAEGTDELASAEITTLSESNALDSKTVLIHGVGIQTRQVAAIVNGGSSLVWCPTSNLFTMGRTITPDVLASAIPIALGTDSALTADGDLLDELRVASSWAPPDRLYQMVTCDAARILKLPPGFGAIQENGPADLLIIIDTGISPSRALLKSIPEIVILNGAIALVSERAAKMLPDAGVPHHVLCIAGRGQYFVRCAVSRMIQHTRRYLSGDLFLAGKQIIQ